jgi:hypothetical protein
MPLFLVTCRGTFDASVVEALDSAGVYWAPGGKPKEEHPAIRERRHHLRIEAEDRSRALILAEMAVSKAGGTASEFEVGAPLSR